MRFKPFLVVMLLTLATTSSTAVAQDVNGQLHTDVSVSCSASSCTTTTTTYVWNAALGMWQVYQVIKVTTYKNLVK